MYRRPQEAIALVLFGFSLIAIFRADDRPIPFRTGFAEKDITPDIGIEAPGE